VSRATGTGDIEALNKDAKHGAALRHAVGRPHREHRVDVGGVATRRSAREDHLDSQGLGRSQSDRVRAEDRRVGCRACRIVGINRRTGTRWRFGRTITGSGEKSLHYAPVISTPTSQISPRYLSAVRRRSAGSCGATKTRKRVGIDRSRRTGWRSCGGMSGELFGGCLPAEGLAGAGVEFGGDRGELLGAVDAQIGALRKILPKTNGSRSPTCAGPGSECGTSRPGPRSRPDVLR